MADALFQFMLEKLSLLMGKQLGLIWGVDKEMEKLLSLLSTMQAVLEDAEEKQVKDKALQNWLRKLKDAAYKVDDILDECATEAARLESDSRNSSLTNKVRSFFLSPHNLLFRHKIGSMMRDVRERLDEIVEERSKFHLIEGGAERCSHVIYGRQTGSILTQSQVYGRDEDKEKVVECLVEKVAGFDGISIYPIVGLGGLGKTTLAQMIFNDDRIISHFELRIWVCVSEDFNVRRIIKAIIESATRSTSQDLALEPLQRDLQNIINGKRYLLILDDVWNQDQEKWDRLKHVLDCGSKGSSIIVTTRIKTIASIMGTMPLHQLSGLIEDDCWSLFKECAFRHETKEVPNLVALGKEIVKKCGGVPLAIKSLGNMISYKSEEHQWLSIVKSEIWSLPQQENSILPALRLSYSNLPSQLRQCFAYCAVFPKNFVIQKDLLVQLWMANGFIPLTERSNPEDIGNEICKELCWRSFLQNVKNDFEAFKMHDLMHDLAQSIMGDECFSKMIESSGNISRRTLHFAMVDIEVSPCSFLKDLYQVESLRTFIIHDSIQESINSSLQNFIYSIYYLFFLKDIGKVYFDFSKLSSLRALSIRWVPLKKLISSISCLSHLRYLDLSFTSLERLPESILTLYNMQTLRLKYCHYLRKLPKHLRHLKNLRHLYLDGCRSLSEMPPQIGQITCLKSLTCFIVGWQRGCHLDELKSLNLGGMLHIKHLERLDNALDGKEANLVGKQNLGRLYLSWNDDGYYQSPKFVEKVLEALQPHPNVKQLSISGYKGAQFPFWMTDNSLNNVVSIELKDCHKCFQLPPLALLPSLQTLHLCRMNRITYIDDGFQGGGTTTGFPSLKSLKIDNLLSLQRFSREDGRQLLPCLTSLVINKCPKLILPHLPNVNIKLYN